MAVLNFGIAPSEFWRMAVQEWFWLAKAKVDQMKAEQEAMKAAADPHYMPDADWDDLRAKHKAKMEAKDNG